MAAGQIKAPMIIPLKDPKGAKSKFLSTNTKIDIISESFDTDIYFTINGSKPDPFKKSSDSFKFMTPFFLPSGKRIVKALAVSNRDGNRISNIVTKNFEIDLEDTSNETNADNVYGLSEDLNVNTKPIRKVERKIAENRRNNPGSPGKYVSTSNPRLETCSALSTNYLQNNDFTQAQKLHREVDFLKCSNCLEPRPSDPSAQFCSSCGYPVFPLPKKHLPLPEHGQLGVCFYCRSTVPMTVSHCLVCESSLENQIDPQASINMRGSVQCSECGTANPPTIKQCLTCETALFHKGSALSIQDPLMAIENKPNLLRTNMYDCYNGNYRSANASSHNQYSMCFKCNASNSKEFLFCSQCGHSLSDWNTRLDKSSTIGNNSGFISIPLHVDQHFNLKNEMIKTKCKNMETQTVGLFYPSSTQIKLTGEKEKPENDKSTDSWNRTYPSIVSPGKGFWRKQVDHIVSHLKAHASNNAEFQALIGEPRMGKLIKSNIEEEEFELNVVLTFSLKGYKDPYEREASQKSDKKYLSSVLKRTSSLESFKSDNTMKSQDDFFIKKKQFLKNSNTSASTSRKLDPKKELIKEISKTGEGRDFKIKEYCDEGVDVNGKTKNGHSYLSIAIKNKHFDAVKALLELGADVNCIDFDSGNTPLHDAVLLGNSFVDFVATLLEYPVDAMIKNKKGETAIHVAQKNNNNLAIQTISSKLGQIQASKLIQSRPNKIVDI